MSAPEADAAASGAPSDPEPPKEGINTKRVRGFLYTSAYCEENVWQLAKSLKDQGKLEGKQAAAVFVSNEGETVAMQQQRSGNGPLGSLVWDYHVVFLLEDDEHKLNVLDLDTTLPFPCPLSEYAQKSFPPAAPRRNQASFRVIPADVFLSTFASDRSHMIRPNGSWASPPPDYPPIATAGACLALAFCYTFALPVKSSGVELIELIDICLQHAWLTGFAASKMNLKQFISMSAGFVGSILDMKRFGKLTPDKLSASS
jgi:hypothetical protein